jgi:Ala-tRNA(Pro) deacylase
MEVPAMLARESLKQYLSANGVSFEEQHHPLAYTAQGVANAEHAPGKVVAKVTIAKANGELIMLVLPASERVDFEKVKNIVGREVSLASESDFARAFPDCETGAMPPFGHLYGLRVYVDRVLAGDEHIIFNEGTHTDTLKIRYGDYERLEHPVVADFAAAHTGSA